MLPPSVGAGTQTDPLEPRSSPVSQYDASTLEQTCSPGVPRRTGTGLYIQWSENRFELVTDKSQWICSPPATTRVLQGFILLRSAGTPLGV